MAYESYIKEGKRMNRRMSFLEKIMTYAILILFAALILYPIVYLIFSSFKTNSEIYVDPANFIPKQFTFENYQKLFASDGFDFWRMLGNSLFYAGWNIIMGILLATTGAYVFARGEFPGKKAIFIAFTALMFVSPGAITIYCTFDIIRALGMTPSLLTMLIKGLFGVPVVSYYMVKGYIDTLPRDLDESAKIDGCSFIGTFFRIILPLLKPIVATMAIFSFQGSWNNYTGVLMWTSSRPQDWTLTVGIMMMRNSGDAAIGVGFTMAAAVFAIIPVLAVFIAFNKFIVDGIAAGAVKG